LLAIARAARSSSPVISNLSLLTSGRTDLDVDTSAIVAYTPGGQHFNPGQPEEPDLRYWQSATVPVLPANDQIVQSSDAANTDDEEAILLEQAKMLSLRDLRVQQEQAQSGTFAKDGQEEERFMAQARLNSFRDLRHEHSGHPGTPPLLGIEKGDDLLRLGDANVPGVIYSTTSTRSHDAEAKQAEIDLQTAFEEVFSNPVPKQPHPAFVTSQQNMPSSSKITAQTQIIMSEHEAFLGQW